MVRCLSEEGGGFGIRVNEVLPDGVITVNGGVSAAYVR
jgi:NAD(P)-dependent dehydrogenase (short-subunit alcohol dehydrogenase family)